MKNLNILETNSKVIWSIVNLLQVPAIMVNEDNYDTINLQESTDSFIEEDKIFIFENKYLWQQSLVKKKFLINNSKDDYTMEVINASMEFFHVKLNNISELYNNNDIYFFGVLKLSISTQLFLPAKLTTPDMFLMNQQLYSWNSLHTIFGKYTKQKYKFLLYLFESSIYSFKKTGGRFNSYLSLVIYYINNL
jgi:hypothetical protein